MIAHRLLLGVVLLASAATAQEIMAAWNLQNPPTCTGLNVTLSFTKNFGDSDSNYAFNISWGDNSTGLIENTTVDDGETVFYSHAYSVAGSYQVFARALDISFQTEISYVDVIAIDGTSCSFESFPPTISPRPTMSPTSFPTMITPTIPPTLAPTVAPPPTTGGGTPTATTEPPSPSPTSTPGTMVDFVATSDRDNPSDSTLHYIVRITDPTTIEQARAEAAKQSDFLLVSGTIDKQAVSWNPNWTFYIRPSTVTLGTLFSETCDVTVKYIQFNMPDAGVTYLPNLQWCPSNSRILREVDTSPSGGDGGGGGSDGDDGTPATAPSAGGGSGTSGSSTTMGSALWTVIVPCLSTVFLICAMI